VPLELVTGSFLAGFSKHAFGFAAAVTKAVGCRLVVVALPLGLFARSAKIDDLTHPLHSTEPGTLVAGPALRTVHRR
jgi:hypothetical protein